MPVPPFLFMGALHPFILKAFPLPALEPFNPKDVLTHVDSFYHFDAV